VCAAAKIERHGHDHGNPIAVSADGKYSVEFVRVPGQLRHRAGGDVERTTSTSA